MHGEIGLYQDQPHGFSVIADEVTHAYILTTGKLRELYHDARIQAWRPDRD